MIYDLFCPIIHSKSDALDKFRMTAGLNDLPIAYYTNAHQTDFNARNSSSRDNRECPIPESVKPIQKGDELLYPARCEIVISAKDYVVSTKSGTPAPFVVDGMHTNRAHE